MKKAALVARYLLGLIYFVFGLNGFLMFLPMPPLEGPSGAFLGALVASGYFLPVLKATEVVGGALLLANLAPKLALVILAPITFQILLFHAFLAPSGLPMAVVMVAAHALLGYANWSTYKLLLKK